ncbi:MAG: hypothetical protein COB46_07795 [Rhodospirillaceae bacterium]|nr:MAG: hypothetical protein COB46_07795 [Rhodospirillaceae bacterium]
MAQNVLQDRAGEYAEEIVLTRALTRAASHMCVSQKILAKVIGSSPSTVSRMFQDDGYCLKRTGKEFELAAFFVRLFRSLDAISGGDDTTSQTWMQANNTVLQGRPVDLIQSIQGLLRTLAYVDSRRGKI